MIKNETAQKALDYLKMHVTVEGPVTPTNCANYLTDQLPLTRDEALGIIQHAVKTGMINAEDDEEDKFKIWLSV